MSPPTAAPVPPSSPASPLNPFNPASPSSPSNPASPGYVSPTSPASPLNPGSPSNPANPSNPATWSNPASPSYIAPSSPASPSNPSNPAYIPPISPASPSNPASPLNPANPAYVSPSSPASPLNPSSPGSPANPASPSYVSPASPASPLNPGNPAKPTSLPSTTKPTSAGQTYSPTTPSTSPTSSPSAFPITLQPTHRGQTYVPTWEPSSEPTVSPMTIKPTVAGQTNLPSVLPSAKPSSEPVTLTPTFEGYTYVPSYAPSSRPSKTPVTLAPTVVGQTNTPTTIPSLEPSGSPVTLLPTDEGQTYAPSDEPRTLAPVTVVPTHRGQTYRPTPYPTGVPSIRPSTSGPTQAPATVVPTSAGQTYAPSTKNPTSTPTAPITLHPTVEGYTYSPTDEPSAKPTFSPSSKPTNSPVAGPTDEPTANAAAIAANSISNSKSSYFIILVVILILICCCCFFLLFCLYRRSKKSKTKAKIHAHTVEAMVAGKAVSSDVDELVPLVLRKSDEDFLEARIVALLAKSKTSEALSIQEQNELLNAPMIGHAAIDADVAEFKRRMHMTVDEKRRLQRVLELVEEGGTSAISTEDAVFLAAAHATGDEKIDTQLGGVRSQLGPLSDIRRLRMLLTKPPSSLTPVESADVNAAIEMMENNQAHFADVSLQALLADFKRKQLLARVFSRAISVEPLDENERDAAETIYRTLRPRIGVAIQEGTADTNSRGVKVVGLAANGPGELAGLLPHDRIISINGNPIFKSADFTANVTRLKPGSFTPLVILRDGVEIDIGLTMGAQGVSTDQTAALYRSLYAEPELDKFDLHQFEVAKYDHKVEVNMAAPVVKKVGLTMEEVVTSVVPKVDSIAVAKPAMTSTSYQAMSPEPQLVEMETIDIKPELAKILSVDRKAPPKESIMFNKVAIEFSDSSSYSSDPSSTEGQVSNVLSMEVKNTKKLLKKAIVNQSSLSPAELSTLKSRIMSLSTVQHGDIELDQLITRHKTVMAQQEASNAKTLELMDEARQRTLVKKEEAQPVKATEDERNSALALLAGMKTRLGLAIEDKDQDNKSKKVKVVAVVPGGSASVAGLQIGDYICEFNGKVVGNSTWFGIEQRKVKAGDDIILSVLRDGIKQDIIVRMGAQGYTLEQIAKLRKVAAIDSSGIGVIQNKASSHKGAQTNFVQVAFTSDGQVKTNFDHSSIEDISLGAGVHKSNVAPIQKKQSQLDQQKFAQERQANHVSIFDVEQRERLEQEVKIREQAEQLVARDLAEQFAQQKKEQEARETESLSKEQEMTGARLQEEKDAASLKLQQEAEARLKAVHDTIFEVEKRERLLKAEQALEKAALESKDLVEVLAPEEALPYERLSLSESATVDEKSAKFISRQASLLSMRQWKQQRDVNAPIGSNYVILWSYLF